MWALSLSLTVLRGVSRWHSQRQIFADDYFIFFGLVSLTVLTIVITLLLPQFYLAGTYAAAAMLDPTTPMPLPPDIFIERTRTSLKLMFSQMLLFWTTLWAGMLIIYVRSLGGVTKHDSEILDPLLFSPVAEWIAEIYQSLVGLLYCGSATISGVHAVQLSDMRAFGQVLEC